MENKSRRDTKLKETLKNVFGYNYFRGNQESIINNILDGKNTFVIMPTGAGKSLCYQLPALMKEGTAIIISPLIALMKNQVDALSGLGVNAHVLNSTLSKSKLNQVKSEVKSGAVKLLYVAPESLTKDENIDFFKDINISLAAIDEAHCISEWGHDFRPEYRRIKSILQAIGQMPIVALTATATPKVQLDIQRNLNMEAADVYKSSFFRENLFYEVRPKVDIKKQLIKFINDRKGQSGIIYCLSRKSVEEVAEFLKVNGIKAAPYHAGLDAMVRVKHQDDFLFHRTDVIVATIAFGMGIDKPDVRFVIHHDAPKSLEGYYQETGRAGRDGLAGDCLMFYNYADILKLEKFYKDKTITERENNSILLQEVSAYAESAVCRTKQLMSYFGETYDKDCGFCDNCKKPKVMFEAKELIILALNTIKLTNERFGMTHLINILRGSKNQYVQSYKHGELSVFNKGKDTTEELWKVVFRNCILLDYSSKDIEHVGVLKLTKKGMAFLENPFDVFLPKNHDYNELENIISEERNLKKGYDQTLYKLLVELRYKESEDREIPDYTIFRDPDLEEMATIYPRTMDELVMISGVGKGKAKKFGPAFLDLISKYVEEYDIVTSTDFMVKTSGQRSKNKIKLIQQVDKRVDLKELASNLNINFAVLLSELENICFSGTKLNLDYYINEILDEESQEDIFDYFLNADNDAIQEALDEFEEEFSEEELRLMRVKFLSEVAN